MFQSRFKKWKRIISCAVLTCFFSSQAWAQGIIIPSGSSLNINAGTLVVPGEVNNAGTLAVTTGSVTLTGNWSNAGTFTPGTGSVVLNGTSGTQTVDNGASDTFYNLTHSAAGTAQLSNHAATISHDFTNSSGTFDANNLNMSIGQDWDNTATFSAGTSGNTVTLNGGDQQILGTTTFYNLIKQVASTATLTLEDTGSSASGQTFTHALTLQGHDASNRLKLRSTTNGTYAKLSLDSGGLQSIKYMDVKDSDAGTSPAQVTLVGGATSVNTGPQVNKNWVFTNTTLTWKGGNTGHETDWTDPANWDLGLVPGIGDSVVIPSGKTYYPDVCPSSPVGTCEALDLADLTIDSGASLNIDGKNLTVSGTLTNSGNLELHGNETLSLTQDTNSSDHGTFTYLGTGTGTSLTIKDFGATDYYNLIIDDTNATKDTFMTNSAITTTGGLTVTSVGTLTTNGNLTVGGGLTLTAGTLDTSAHTNSISVTGAIDVNGGTWTATNSTIAAGSNVTISSGALSAPSSTSNTAFTVAGNWAHTGGTFTPSSGKVILTGSHQSISGSTTFSLLYKVVGAADTLTFQNGSTQTVTGGLTLKGAANPNRLTLVSDSAGQAFGLALSSGGTQDIENASVKDSNASSGVKLVDRGDYQDATGNTNWQFGAVTLTWKGGASSHTTDWTDPLNWDLGLVPGTGDSVVVPGSLTYYPDVCPPSPLGTCAALDLVDLTIDSGASLNMDGKNLQVTGTLGNSGNLELHGNETLTLTMDTTHGTVTYLGDGDGTSNARTLTINGSNNVAFNNLVINDANTTPADRDVFETNGTLTVSGTLQLTSGTLNTSANSNAVTVTGAVTVDGGTWTATNSTIAAGSDVTISSGVLTAPSSTSNTGFTVAGHWSHSAGTFTSSSGKVTLTGTNQSISGSTDFGSLRKVVSAADTLTFQHGSTQTVSGDLTLEGAASPNRLALVSDSAGNAFNLYLPAGHTQTLQDLDVKDSNAGTSPTDVTLVDRGDYHDSGNNTHWVFGAATLTWKGGDTGHTTDWTDPSNWDLGLVPTSGDSVVVPSSLTYYPDACPSSPGPVGTCAALDLKDLTINSGASLKLNGQNLSASGTFSNSGNVELQGNETLTLTMDATHGTVTYLGDGDATSNTRTLAISASNNVAFNNLVIDDANATSANRDVFQTNGTLTVNGTLHVTSGTLDTSTHSNAVTATGAVTIDGGVWTANNSTIAAGSDVTISSGSLSGPSSAADTAFTVAGNWTNSVGAAGFTANNGAVNFTTTATATITGNTTFYDFVSKASGKTIKFTAGSNQIVAGKFNLLGSRASDIFLRSTAMDHTPWSVTFPNGTQTVNALDVEDSDALTNTVTCLNCTDSTHNNTNWLFFNLRITAPYNLTATPTVGQTPAIMGQGPAGKDIAIEDAGGKIVATTTVQSNGYFRVTVGQDNDSAAAGSSLGATQLAVSGSASLTPYLEISPGNSTEGLTNNVIVKSDNDITPDNVPTVGLTNNQKVSVSEPVISGKAKALCSGSVPCSVQVWANDAAGGLLLQQMNASTDTVDAGGNYSVKLTTPLASSTNYLSVVVNGVSSPVVTIILTDPAGYVFDSSSDKTISNALVYLYTASGGKCTTNKAAVSSCDSNGTCTSDNPMHTDSTGFYSFLASSGQYCMSVSSSGYNYPSKLASFPTDRVIDPNGASKGGVFTVGTTFEQIDHPVDGNGYLLRIEKSANKTQAQIGDVVTYSVKIENLSGDNAVQNFLLSDRIPPGFKYISGRVLRDGTPISDPAGQRPLNFSISNINPSTTTTLRYQLVIGSGVTMGNYENQAVAEYGNGVIISNQATANVKVVPDPLFDLGTVIGKVFYDWNENGVQDPPRYDATEMQTIVEKPVPNAQIIMEDGTIITTDRNGQFSIPGLLPGRHIFRLDERSLPPGSYLTTDKAVLVNITAGSMTKVNFGVDIDNTKVTGKDAVFFNEKMKLTQDTTAPVPRLNAALFSPSPQAPATGDEVVLYQGLLVHQAEFRIFTNYQPFINSWQLDIIDQDTKKLIKRFQGSRLTINDPIYWDGRDENDQIIQPEHHYAYYATVTGLHGNRDTTQEKPITVRVVQDDVGLQKEKDNSPDTLKGIADRYQKWIQAASQTNAIDRQGIPITGQTIHLDRQGTDVRSVRIMKGDKLFVDMPLTQQYGLTPQELIAGGLSGAQEKDNVEMILPDGDYTIDAIGAKTPEVSGPAAGHPKTKSASSMPSGVPAGPSPTAITPAPAGELEHYSRPLKVGDDYLMFVALGDATVGYNIDRGNIEPVQSDDQYKPGFWHQGKAAYYLKGKILGKYLITSSFDTDRQQKALFRQLDPNTYYPVYGDNSSINYDATDTQGPLYLLVQWDKSSAIWGNYAIDFNNTQFANFTRSYYGGKIDYQSVANNPYGDPHTKLVVFHAQVQQLPDHDEYLATGGSLYFLKYRNVIQGSDKIRIEVRDQTTGLVLASKDMVNGADYELDDEQGRILFWQPVAMIAKSESIISNAIIDGNPIYVVVDYQYQVQDKLNQSSEGVRVAQAVGNNVVLGGTYVKETQTDGTDYQLEGTDATVHLGPNATVKAEYAQTKSQSTGQYVSTDGGITFTQLSNGSGGTGKAYGITGDARLFNRVGISSYYNWVGNSFAGPQTSSQQGKQSAGLHLTFDLTPETRLTANEDIQKLINGGNLQTEVQVGASETDTTLVQIEHQSGRLSLTGAFQLQKVKNVVNGIVSSTNQQSATIAGKAEYALTDRIKLSLEQQVDTQNPANTATTAGIEARVTNRTVLRGLETFSQEGTATTLGATNQITPKMAVTTAYTMANQNTGETDKTATVGLESKVSKNLAVTGAVALTSASTGATTVSGSVGGKARLNQATSVDLAMGRTQSSTGQGVNTVSLNGQARLDDKTTFKTTIETGGASFTPTNLTNPAIAPTDLANPNLTPSDLANTNGLIGIGTTGVTTTSFSFEADQKVNDKTENTSTVSVQDNTVSGKTTTVDLATKTKLNDEFQSLAERSFGFSPGGGATNGTKYGVVRTKNGHTTEADYTTQVQNLPGNNSQSNIFGLSGDINDRLAVNGSIEKGKVQNLDGTQTSRMVFSAGLGYVLKDTVTAEERLKDSAKVELELDNTSGDRTRQIVLYNAFDGKITDNWSVTAKLDYSETRDTTTNVKSERHNEIILGMAYRPVNFDNLNVVLQYSYKDGYGLSSQIDDVDQDVNETKLQVYSAQGIYDINDHWQAVESLAYRIMEEQDTGFAFTETHTWLMIHRLNYKIDRDWTVGAEYRDLGVTEAKDNKKGLLVEATRNINDFTQLAIGWNFTDFSDDLTDLSYNVQGPYLRMDGKFYDESPEERARERAKWLDERISQWAWTMVKKELSNKNSKIVVDLNAMFALAKASQAHGHYKQARQIYKDIITAGQMMFEEACEYIRHKIDFEKQMVAYDKTAKEYYHNGEYEKAGKIWQKIVDDASKRVVK